MDTTMGRLIELAPDPDELSWLRAKHMEYYLALAERTEGGTGVPGLHDIVHAERANIGLAIEWAQATDDAESVLRITSALFWYWHARELDAQSRRWTEWALARTPAASPAREKALRSLGWTQYWAGEYADAHGSFEEALSIARALDVKTGIAWGLDGLAWVAHANGDIAGATAMCEEALRVARDAGNRDDVAHLLQELGWLHMWATGDQDAARRAVEESLAAFRQLRTHDDHVGLLLQQLGEIAQGSGDLERAKASFEESVEFLRSRGEEAGRALAFLAGIARTQGDSETAARLAREALIENAEHGRAWGLAYSLEAFGDGALGESDPVRAVRLWGAADALRERIQKAPFPQEREAYEARLAALRASLEESAFRSAWAEGRAMTTEEAVAYALGT